MYLKLNKGVGGVFNNCVQLYDLLLKIKDFNINNITFTKKDDKTYNIKYQDKNFLLLADSKFRT